jgi:hypothetical protein
MEEAPSKHTSSTENVKKKRPKILSRWRRKKKPTNKLEESKKTPSKKPAKKEDIQVFSGSASTLNEPQQQVVPFHPTPSWGAGLISSAGSMFSDVVDSMNHLSSSSAQQQG